MLCGWSATGANGPASAPNAGGFADLTAPRPLRKAEASDRSVPSAENVARRLRGPRKGADRNERAHTFERRETVSDGGGGNSTGFFTSLLTVLFIGLKLGGVIAWSWWWVLSPIWITSAVALVALGVYFAVKGPKL
jgi:hypothetical protein